jgi:hypothetical protein
MKFNYNFNSTSGNKYAGYSQKTPFKATDAT